MMPPASEGSDRPFPGGHAQVPRARTTPANASSSIPASLRSLPLKAVRDRSDKGWVVCLRVRAEHVTVRKEVVVSERVVLRRVLVGDVLRLDTVVQRERLRLDTEGPVQVAGSPDQRVSVMGDVEADRVRQHPEQLAARHGLPWRRDASGRAADLESEVQQNRSA